MEAATSEAKAGKLEVKMSTTEEKRKKAVQMKIKKVKFCFVGVSICVLLLLLFGCALEKETVVVYTSVDQVYSEPVFSRFEQQTGIRIKAVYDIEAQKSVGLAVRLEAERENPTADVFWSGEFTKTVDLFKKGVLSSYDEFGGRVRVLLINTELIEPKDEPESIFDLVSDKYAGYKIAIAKPLFGTTFSHACALYAQLGDVAALDFFNQIKEKQIMIVEGNSVVRDMVASGTAAMGLTDTDDAYAAIEEGAPVKMIFLDSNENGMGTLIIPNTVGKVSQGPNSENADAFIAFLLSDETEIELYHCGWIDLVKNPELLNEQRFDTAAVKAMAVSYEAICDKQATAAADLKELFLD